MIDGVAATLTVLMHIIFTDVDTVEFHVDPSGGTVSTFLLDIPADGWKEAEEENEDFRLICDVPCADVTSAYVPMATVMPGYRRMASRAGIMSGCDTFEGFVRFYAMRKPDKDIKAAVAVFCKGGAADVGAGLAYGRDGKMRVVTGNGLTIDENNAVAVDEATDADIDAIVRESEEG